VSKNGPQNTTEKLVDKWPDIQSAAEWNREEKEREIKENLAKMAGITIGAPVGGKQSALSKGLKAKLMSQQSLKLELQYQQQNFATLTSFESNRVIRVGHQYQTEVTREVYPGVPPERMTSAAKGVNPEESQV